MSIRKHQSSGFVSLLVIILFVVLLTLLFIGYAIKTGLIDFNSSGPGTNNTTSEPTANPKNDSLFGKLVKEPNVIVDQEKLKRSKLETPSSDLNDKTGEVYVTQDAVVSKVVEVGKEFLLLASDKTTLSAKLTASTVVKRVTSYDYDKSGNIIGLSIGDATLADTEGIMYGDTVRITYPMQHVPDEAINLSKVVIYLKK